MRRMKLTLTERQVGILQSVLAGDYVRGRIDNETEPTVEPAWLRSLLTLGKSIERQTQIKSEVQYEADCWVTQKELNGTPSKPRPLRPGEVRNLHHVPFYNRF